MKNLKKHPKQQRMEDMTFPITKPLTSSGPLRVEEYTVFTSGGLKITYDSRGNEIKKEYFPLIPVEKVTMTGREYLRSINDDNGFRLMPRIVWRVVAVGVFVGAIIISIYLYGKR